MFRARLALPRFRLDKDGSGYLEMSEVKSLLDSFYEGDTKAPPYEADALMRLLDTNRDGRISWSEFAAALGARKDSGPDLSLKALSAAAGPPVPGPNVTGTISVLLEGGKEVQIDAAAYMEQLKAEAEVLRKELNMVRLGNALRGGGSWGGRRAGGAIATLVRVADANASSWIQNRDRFTKTHTRARSVNRPRPAWAVVAQPTTRLGLADALFPPRPPRLCQVKNQEVRAELAITSSLSSYVATLPQKQLQLLTGDMSPEVKEAMQMVVKYIFKVSGQWEGSRVVRKLALGGPSSDLLEGELHRCLRTSCSARLHGFAGGVALLAARGLSALVVVNRHLPHIYPYQRMPCPDSRSSLPTNPPSTLERLLLCLPTGPRRRRGQRARLGRGRPSHDRAEQDAAAVHVPAGHRVPTEGSRG